MIYRHTENVARKLAARQEAILHATRTIAGEQGMAAVQIAPVAQRAGIAAGTVYRYFPAKSDLVAALIAAHAGQEISALNQAADAAPGPLSALAAAITTFAGRALGRRRLAFAVLAEPVEAESDTARMAFRRALAGAIAVRIQTARASGNLPDIDSDVAAVALIGALIEGLIGPLAPSVADDPSQARNAIQTLTLMSLRALGVVDARARGLVVQTALPRVENAA